MTPKQISGYAANLKGAINACKNGSVVELDLTTARAIHSVLTDKAGERPTIYNKRTFIDAAMHWLPGYKRSDFRMWMAEMGIPEFGHPEWSWDAAAAHDLAMAYKEEG